MSLPRQNLGLKVCWKYVFTSDYVLKNAGFVSPELKKFGNFYFSIPSGFHQRLIVAVWLDWVIYCTLGNFSKPIARIIFPKLPTYSSNFCKVVKIFNFSSEIFLGNFYRHLATFYLSNWLVVNVIKLNWSSSRKHWF